MFSRVLCVVLCTVMFGGLTTAESFTRVCPVGCLYYNCGGYDYFSPVIFDNIASKTYTTWTGYACSTIHGRSGTSITVSMSSNDAFGIYFMSATEYKNFEDGTCVVDDTTGAMTNCNAEATYILTASGSISSSTFQATSDTLVAVFLNFKSTTVSWPLILSITATSSSSDIFSGSSSFTTATCFPADALLELANGDAIQMDKLQVGHKIRVGAKEHSDVFMFSHQYTDAAATFVELSTATNGALRLTPGHFLYVNGVVAPARTVKVGDVLEAADGSLATVTGVSTVRATGLYNPHTLHGDVVVNGFRTTTYTDAIHPTMAHALLAPIRALYILNTTLPF